MASNAAMNDYNPSRKPAYHGQNNYHQPYGHSTSQAQSLRNAQYLSASTAVLAHNQHDGMGALNHGFNSLSLNSTYTSSNRGNLLVTTGSSDYPVTINQNPLMYPGSQQVVYPPHPLVATAGNATNNQIYGHLPAFISAPNYDTKFMQSYSSDNNVPTNASWSSRVPSDASHTVPTLITPRRGSVSSNEEHLPATPYHNYVAYSGGVAILDRSPSGVATNTTTPSPSSYVPGYSTIGLNAKQYQPATIPVQLQLLIQQEPSIPRAIPAPSSPVKPLDRCLENKNGETNVYIRGLLPETTDEMLHIWGSRFGDIASSKSIIDHKNTLCKGFGFIKYHNFEDAENCIRGFHHLGYEVSFARESFYSKLKKFSDESNTNLYVSNIPRNYNEHELSQTFSPFKVMSARILRDERGNGRGVGFARFESRDVCEEVIKKFNNTPVAKPGGDEYIIQIRYSDTHEQKMLKQQTAAARQFRAAEFEYGCLEARRAGLLPQSSVDRLAAANESTGSANEFEQYINQDSSLYPQTNSGIKSFGQTLPTIKSDSSPSPGLSTPATAIKVEDAVHIPREHGDNKEKIASTVNGNGVAPVVINAN